MEKEIYKGYLVYVPITGWLVTLVAKVNGKERSFLVRLCNVSYRLKKRFMEHTKIKYFIENGKAKLIF